MILDFSYALIVPLYALLALPVASWATSRDERPLEGPESLSLAYGFALAWVMLGGMVLCGLGLLSQVAVGVWMLAGASIAIACGARSGFRSRSWFESFEGWTPLWAIVPPLLFLLLLALIPPWYRDSLTDHLALPRFYALHGGFAAPDQNLFHSYPLGWESVLAMLHTFGGPKSADPLFNPRLLGAWTMGGVALATLSLARSAGASRLFASGVGVLLLLIPTVVEFGSSAYVEGSLVLFSTLAFNSYARSLSTSIASQGRIPYWTAVWAGVAAWTKYPALAVVAAVILVCPILEVIRTREIPNSKVRLRWIGWATAMLAIASPFLLRNLWTHGNPVYPVAYSILGGAGWDDWRAWAFGVTLKNYGYGREWIDYIALPWRLFTQRDLLHGFEGALGPLLPLGFASGLGLLLSPATRERNGEATRSVWLLLVIWLIGFWFFWAATVQQSRYFMLAIPALLALLAAGGSTLVERAARHGYSPRKAGMTGLLLLGMTQLFWSAPVLETLWSRQHSSDYLSGSLTRDDLLSRLLPESFPIMQELDQLVPPHGRVWLVWMRGHTYYLTRPYRVDSVFEAWRLEALLDESGSQEEVLASLEADGITHLLIHHRFFLANNNADLREGRTQEIRVRFDSLLHGGVLEPIKSWGPITLYRVAASVQRPFAQDPSPDNSRSLKERRPQMW